MMFLSSVRFALRVMGKRPLRSFLTILQVALGVAIVAVIINLNLQMTEAVRERHEGTQKQLRLEIRYPQPEERAPGEGRATVTSVREEVIRPISIDEYRKIREAGIFQYISPVQNSHNMLLEARGNFFGLYSMAACDVDLPYMEGFRLLAGDFFAPEDVEAGRSIMLMHSQVARSLFGSDEEALGETVNVSHSRMFAPEVGQRSETYTIVGVYEHRDFQHGYQEQYYSLVPYTRRPDGDRQSFFHQFLVQMPSGLTIDMALERLDALLPGREGRLTLNPFGPSLEMELGMVRQFSIFLGVFGFIALVVSCISIFSITMVNVVERDNEIGLRRALGTSKRGIMLQILTESSLYSLAGGILGLIIGLNMQSIFFTGPRALLSVPVPVETGVAGFTIIFSLGVAVLMGNIFGFYPALQAASLSPVEALREQ